jgi:5-formyltetrahydrofolate cyclo-ligase
MTAHHDRTAARALLRSQLRLRRDALPPQQRAAAAAAITRHIAAMPWLAGGRNIGLYVARSPEVDTASLRALARRRRCRVFLPRILDYRAHRLAYCRERGPLVRLNRYGIAEPDTAETVGARWLSVAFLPLLGFDPAGTRLGTGSGYFDRLLAFRRHRRAWQRPLLVGIGYRCQQLPVIERSAHDVPLDAVATEDGIEFFMSTPAA